MTQPRDFSLYGAVDLGARQAAAQRREQVAAQAARAQEAGESGEPDAGGAVIDVTDETVNTDVVVRSQTTPVIMDLWAEWCGPCKQLSPVLERLAAEANGAWILAKVDVDANPQIAQALRVQSIPMVVAWVGGQPVDAFLGAVPEAQVTQWIDQVLAMGQQMGVGGGAEPSPAADAADAADLPDLPEADQLPDGYSDVQSALERGDFDAAANALEKVLASTPADAAAKSLLAQVNLQRRINSYDESAARAAAAAGPGDVDAQLKVADLDLAAGRTEEAFDRLLGVIRRTSGEDRDKARVHLVSLFEIFPPRDPAVTRARGTLSSLLF
jgi:putative thioredoxin